MRAALALSPEPSAKAREPQSRGALELRCCLDCPSTSRGTSLSSPGAANNLGQEMNQNQSKSSLCQDQCELVIGTHLGTKIYSV